MPANVTIEFMKAKEKYQKARTREEKIAALEEMLSTIPKHKGTENMQAEIKSKLSKLRKMKAPKVARHAFSLPKEGDAQVCIIGLTQSGKSTLLASLTNAKPKIAPRPYTTTKPKIGMIEWKGVKIQLVEIPSTFQKIYMSVAQNSDGIIVMYDSTKDLEKQKQEMEKVIKKFRISRPMIEVMGKKAIDTEKLKESIWGMLGLIRVYTKTGKRPEKRALVLKKGATVEDAARHLHKDFIKFFKFARVWGRSAKHSGQHFGLEHVLKDGDILEFHLKR